MWDVIKTWRDITGTKKYLPEKKTKQNVQGNISRHLILLDLINLILGEAHKISGTQI
jgi:hypothetical protein